MNTKHGRISYAQRLRNDVLSRRALGLQVIKRAKALGLNQAQLALVVDDAATQMSRLYNGHYEEFSAERLAGFLTKLGCRINMIVRHPKATRLGRAPRHARISQILIGLLAFVMAIGTSACDRATAPRDPVGQWAITAIDGQAPPVTLIAGTPAVDPFKLYRGNLDIMPDAGYALTICYAPDQPAPYSGCYVESRSRGTWTRAGNTVTLTDASGGVRTLHVEARTLVQAPSPDADGRRVVYSRQK